MPSKRKILGTVDTTIRDGVWTITQYDDGTHTAKLTEWWDTPLPLSALATDAQREIQAEYEAVVRRKGL